MSQKERVLITTSLPDSAVDAPSLISAPSYRESPFAEPSRRVGLPIDAHAQSLRNAARLNASKISRQEHLSLLAEREELLKAKYERGLSIREITRLEYVRWSLDRIEDAKHGASLDTLEAAVYKYREALSELQALRASLDVNLPRSKK